MPLPGQATKTDAGHWTRATFIDEAGATNLPEVIINLRGIVAPHGNLLGVWRNAYNSTHPHGKRFQFKEQFSNQIHVAFHERSLTRYGEPWRGSPLRTLLWTW